jgi:hypothetical protein
VFLGARLREGEGAEFEVQGGGFALDGAGYGLFGRFLGGFTCWVEFVVWWQRWAVVNVVVSGKGDAIDRAMEVLTGLLHSVVGNAFHVQPFPTAFL